MSNIFNTKRAVNYLAHDLNAAKNNYLYSMLVLGLMPVISFILYEIFALLINKGHLDNVGVPFQNAVFFISIATLVITFPIKQYGGLTDKRYGSDWLMIPASTFEKWLSMLIMTCLVLPVVFFTMYLGSDWLLSVIFPNIYPAALISEGTFRDMLTNFGGSFEDSEVTFNFLGVGYMSWAGNVLVITLGAIVFKRAKFPKTILACTGIMMLVVFLILMLNNFDFNFNDEDFERWLGSGDSGEFARRLNVFITVVYAVYFAILDGGLYLRLKTLKH